MLKRFQDFYHAGQCDGPGSSRHRRRGIREDRYFTGG